MSQKTSHFDLGSRHEADLSTMSIPLENTILDSLLRVPKISFGESENLDTQGLIAKLLDFNPRHEWHAYIPGALNSILRDVASPQMKRRLQDPVRTSFETAISLQHKQPTY